MKSRLTPLAASLALACGANSGEGPRLRGGEWPALTYQPQDADPPLQGIHEDEEAKAIRAGLESRYGEPFELTWVSRETFSAPGWPGGAAGRFEAHPQAHPELHFGGFNGTELVDNYDCIRAAKPVLDWVAERSAATTLGAEHRCEHSAKQASRVQLWLFDDSGRAVDELVAELRSELDQLLAKTQAGPHPLEALTLTLSLQAPGSGPTVRKVVTTSRRGVHARHWARKRELASAKLDWAAGAWTVEKQTPTHVRAVEEHARQVVAASQPPNTAFEVERLGPTDATIEDIARRERVREAVHVHVRLDGPHEAQTLAAWIRSSHEAIDPRLLLHWHFTSCKQGAARPWADPEDCQAGWDDITFFILDRAREVPQFWPFPPAFD